MHKSRRPHSTFRPQAVALGAALLFAAALPAQAQAQTQTQTQFYSYSGAVATTPGNAFPIDVSIAMLDLRPNALFVGNSAAGTFSALAGSDFQADALVLGTGGTGSGNFSVSGASSLVSIRGTGSRVEVGSWGVGALTVSGGALFDAASDTAACAVNNCRNYIGNGAGSTGTLTVTGAGSELRLVRTVNVGQTSVFTDAGSGFDFGTPGGTTNAFVDVLDGGTLRTETAVLASNNAGPNGNGNEKANATVQIKGVGSQWIVGRNSVDNTGAFMIIGGGSGSNGLVTVSEGGTLHIDGTGSSGPNDGINIGSNGKGTLIVTGLGSSFKRPLELPER